MATKRAPEPEPLDLIDWVEMIAWDLAEAGLDPLADLLLDVVDLIDEVSDDR